MSSITRQRKTRKSHHGCSECKRRSVKCDEKRPQCSNCKYRRTTCRYTTFSPWLWAEADSYPDLTSARLGAIGSSEQAVIQHSSYRSLLAMAPVNTQHFRLLLNWTTSTCQSISRNQTDTEVWQRVIPQRALSCPYLLHGIFAISALHLALSSGCSQTEQQAFIECAEQHHSEAIRMFTNFGDQLGPPENVESFALSSLLIGSAFAFPLAVSTRCRKWANALDEIVQVFMLSRKMINFSTPMMSDVQTHELGGLFTIGEEQTIQTNLSKSSQQAIVGLHEILNIVCSPEHENYQVFNHTIGCLEQLLGKLDGAGELISGSFIWICDVPAAFISLLSEHNPFALVILAHYCVVLHQLRNRWWISSWGEQVLHVIVRTLSPVWKPSVAWALNAVNTS